MTIDHLKVAENISIINKLRNRNIEFYKGLTGKSFKTKFDYYEGEINEIEYDVDILFYDEDGRMLYIKYSHPYYEEEPIFVSENIILDMISNQ